MARKRTVKQDRVASKLKRDMEAVWAGPLANPLRVAKWVAHPGGYISCRNRAHFPVLKRSKD